MRMTCKCKNTIKVKTTSSLFLSKMIANYEWALRTKSQSKENMKTPHTLGTPTNNESTTIKSHHFRRPLPQRICGNRKRSKQSTNADQRSIETVFSIAFCRQSGDILSPVGRQNGNQNSVSNDFLSTFVDNINVFDCRLSGVIAFFFNNHCNCTTM